GPFPCVLLRYKLVDGSQGQREVKSAANSPFAFHPNFSAVKFDNQLTDSQPQTCTANGSIRGVGAIEFLKKIGLLFRRETDPSILYTHLQMVSLYIQLDGDGALRGRILDGVGQ